jgi:hypothetical protein
MQRWWLAALAALVAGLLLVRVADKAGDGRQALVKWTPQIEALLAGENVYERSDSGRVRTEGVDATESAEGFPTPPLTALLLAPFARLGPVAGSVAFAALKLACAAFTLAVALRLAFANRAVPALAAVIVVALTARVIASDVSHGNTNLVVLGVLAAALLAHERHMPALCGLFVAFASVLKLTPLLFVLFFLVRRDRAALLGFASGLVLFAIALPGALLGFAWNLELLAAFGQQMVLPYLEGRPLTLLVTEHTNQSLFGVLARLTTDSIAIEARTGVWESDVRIGLVHLDTAAFTWLHRGVAFALVAATIVALFVRNAKSDGLRAFALLSLAMVALSERSWKQHYVVLVFPLAYLVAVAFERPGRARSFALAALVLSALTHALSGEGLLGERTSDLLEAHGAFLLGALALFAATALVYSRSSAPPDASPSPGSR